MKHELIKTKHYLLVVSDEEIKEGDYALLNKKNHLEIQKALPSCLKNAFKNAECWNVENKVHEVGHKKIIAHLPLPIKFDAYGQPLHYLDGVDVLPRLIGEAEQLAEQLANDYANEMRCDDGTTDEDFLQGFNKAKETYKYTEEDMHKMFYLGCSLKTDLKIGKVDYKPKGELFKDYLQSINQPKLPIAFEGEPKYLDIDEIREKGKGFLNGNPIIQKTITNSEGRTEWVGKYLF